MYVLLKHLRNLRKEIALPSAKRRGSLALRHVDAGSCNGCEHELTAASNPFYDLQRFGLNIVASPRHADVLLVTGQVTTRMIGPLLRAFDAMPEPRLVAALGDCALGCGVLGQRTELAPALDRILPVDLRIRGCPPRPDEIADALLELMGERGRASHEARPDAMEGQPARDVRDGRCAMRAGPVHDEGQSGAPYS